MQFYVLKQMVPIKLKMLMGVDSLNGCLVWLAGTQFLISNINSNKKTTSKKHSTIFRSAIIQLKLLNLKLKNHYNLIQ